MDKIKKIVSKLTKQQKITYSFLASIFIIMLLIGIPTLATLVNSNGPDFPDGWDGITVANSYKGGTGTEEDPYIISDGPELAFFSQELNSYDYENTYFALGGNIVLNEGIFDYDANDGIMYLIDDTRYYVDAYTNNYYLTSAKTGSPVGTINNFPTLPNFKGYLEGKQYTIYGLYMADYSAYELGLFTNLRGEIKNIQLANIMIYGGVVTGSLAGSADGATIHNVLVDGFVVGTKTETGNSMVINPPNTTFTFSAMNPTPTFYVDVLVNLPFVGGQFTNSTISGRFNPLQGSANQMVITVNGVVIPTGNQATDFGPINTGVDISNVPIMGEMKNPNGVFELTGMVFTVYWNYAATGGVIGHANNTELIYIINKSEVNGVLTSGGIVGTSTGSLNIESSYNNGIIRGAFSAGGLVGIIDKNDETVGSNISKSYNTGSIAPAKPSTYGGGLIGYLFNNPGDVNLSNVFNTANNYSLGNIKHTTVNLDSGYYVFDDPIGDGIINGIFTKMTTAELQAEEILKDIGFEEYISEEDMEEYPEHCWVYKDNEFPLLYSDTKVKPAANIYIGSSIYSKYSENLNTKPLKNITFLIEAANLFHPIMEKYYYITTDGIPLLLEELEELEEYEWIPAGEVEQINVEGTYIVYAKVVDYSENITYMNTDILLLDMTSPSVEATLNLNTWNNLRGSQLPHVTLLASEIITIDASDSFSGINEIKYYTTDAILSSTDLDNLSENLWTTYDDGIILANGSYIVYIKVDDMAGNITYINSDIIDYSSYEYNGLTIGRGDTYGYSDIYISDKSLIAFNTVYLGSGSIGINTYTHHFMSNTLLPMGTKITLIDHEKNKVYEYKVPTSSDIFGFSTSCEVEETECMKTATYPFTLFKEIGSATNKMYIEDNYYDNGVTSEDFTITVDFKDANIVSNYFDVLMFIELYDETSSYTARPTSYYTVTPFNIVTTKDGIFTLQTEFSGDITYNTESLTNINFNARIDYGKISTFDVIDTTLNDKYMGLALKMVDNTGTLIDNYYFKNMIFKVSDEIYSPDSDNILRIPLSEIENFELNVTTSNIVTDLTPGPYYLKVATYIGESELYGNILSYDISIPITVVSNTISDKHDFDVTMDVSKQIINKNDPEVQVVFDIFNKHFTNPSVHVSLYEKSNMSAFNQDYDIVDLLEYVRDDLTKYSNNIYTVNIPNQNNNFALEFDTIKLDNTGYKIVFEFYDGIKKVGSINKYFIVK